MAVLLEPEPTAEAVTTLPTFPLDGSIPTLGWEAISWIETMLVQPDGENAGDLFRLTHEQLNFVLWWYAVNDAGKFVYQRGVLRRSKGWGKSPFMAALCLVELCGPVRFGGWEAPGSPIGVSHPMPWVNLAGVSETQTQNTMTVVLAMLEGAPATEEYGLDVGLTRIYTPGGGRLLPITASSSTQEGARPSCVVADETHHWLESNGGHKLANVLRRNLAKSRDGSARMIETTNAHAPGYDSVAEASYLAYIAWIEGRAPRLSLLYDSREAPGGIDLADEPALRAGLRAAYGDATWLDLDRLVQEIYDPTTPPEDSRRFYLNNIVAAADSWVAPHEWDRNKLPELEPLAEGDTITLGFDGGLTDDSTALVAMRVSDGAPFLLGLWEKPEGPKGEGWYVDKDDVRGTVAYTLARYDVVAWFADVAEWETDVDAWRDEYGERMLVKATVRHAIAYDLRGHQAEATRAAEALNRAILDGTLPHNGDPRLSRHVYNARRRLNRFGISFGKETRESPKKVDAVAALMLARMARTSLLGSGALAKRRSRTGRAAGF